MNYGDVFSIRPGEVSDATGQFAELADRIQRVMDSEALNLTVQPCARDEVSQRVATTLNEVHASFSKASNQGHQELHDISAAMGSHADSFAAADEALSA